MSARQITATIAAITALAAAAAADTPYLITDLGHLGGDESRAYALNAAGQVVGRSRAVVESTPVWHAFVYSGGAMQDLDTLGGDESEAWGINGAGEVVGWAQDAGGDTLAFLYTGAPMAGFDPLGGHVAAAYAVNDAGQVVGTAETVQAYQHAFLWTDADGDDQVGANEVLELPPLNGNAPSPSHARDVNAAGQVAGYSQAAGLHHHAFFFHDANGNAAVDAGEMVDLQTLGGDASEAHGLNDAGQVVGWAQTGSGHTHAFLWTDLDGDGQWDANETDDLGAPADGKSVARAVNQHGAVVGYAQDADATTWAFLHQDGAMHDLNDLLADPNANWQLQEAWDVNDGAQIVGFGRNGDGATRGFLLTPLTRGDANLDGLVDGADYTTWADHYGQTGVPAWSDGGWTVGNWTEEDIVDGADYTVWADNYCTGASAQPTPEPLTALLLAAAGPWALRRRRAAMRR